MSPTVGVVQVGPVGRPVPGPTRREAPGLVTFCVGTRLYAVPLTHVREVVRLVGLTGLEGMTPPLAGVVDLRGTCLPVLDLRHGRTGASGDVLVLDTDDETMVGVAVDQVRAVVDAVDLPAASPVGAGVLPAYVLGVLRGAAGPVFLVDLLAMARAPQAAGTVR